MQVYRVRYIMRNRIRVKLGRINLDSKLQFAHPVEGRALKGPPITGFKM